MSPGVSSACLPALLWVVPVLAQDPSPTAQAQPAVESGSDDAVEWVGGAPFWQWSRVTGTWGGGRDWLEQHGIEVGGGYTADWAAAWSGGVRNRDNMPSLIDVNVAFDLETLLGLPRTTLFVDAYAIEGRLASDDVGDSQGFSNIQSDNTEQVAEAWLETWVADFRIKVGKVDFNSEFAFNETGGDFINSSAAISPTIVNYPTYPDPATAVNLFWAPSETFYLGAGIYDGAAAAGIPTGRRAFSGFFEDDESDAWFLAVELGTAWTGGDDWGSGRFALGAWQHTADFATFAGGTESGTTGLYATFEQRLWRENPGDAEDGQGFGLFATAGLADDDLAAIGANLVVGVAWTGALAGRDHDVTGLAVLHADLSDDPGAATPDDETAFELFHKIQLTPAISLKPDLQYIVNPGGDGAALDDALVGTLRFEIAF
ncbi:MAG: carbohydrate porin [Planctomycetes bacterium]|nr:carbohydrate porin [Planctomycetota bacterium]